MKVKNPRVALDFDAEGKLTGISYTAGVEVTINRPPEAPDDSVQEETKHISKGTAYPGHGMGPCER